MIDVVVGETGTLMLLHDKGDCSRIDAIEIRGDGLVAIVEAERGKRELRRLSPRMQGLARGCQQARVIEMDRYEVADDYPCRLRLAALGD